MNNTTATTLVVALMTINGLSVSTDAACIGDINNDQIVEVDDFFALLQNWGNCPAEDPCPWDIAPYTNEQTFGDGIVGVADFFLLLQNWGSCDAVEIMQLAGNPLSQYPYFEFVTAFNAGSDISLAVDPSRVPHLVGSTCEVYIVAARTEAEWAVDNTLSDVRGAAQTISLIAGTVQDNTFTLTDSDTLSADAGLGLGVGYDLVCDCNQDGLLNGEDLIDGLHDEAGMYVVHDTTLPGPLSVIEETYNVQTGSVTSGFTAENLFYPSNIASMGRLPLIIVSHGNGHNYAWYDHIGNHMASYGYVVMSHANNTVPGVESAATTTLEHTDAFLGQLGTIAGGVLVGHVDTTRITWIGHSRGGEGVAIAYDRIVDGTWTPVNYRLEDIVLVSSIAPVDFQGPGITDPHDVNFHLWTGGADDDVWGCASSDLVQTFHLHDRATEYRQSISLHGVGHGDFHNGGGSSVADGPCLVGRADTHTVMRGYLLPLVLHYVEGNIPAKDFLWRQWESFRPIGAPNDPCLVVDLMYRGGGNAGRFVIDDFQTTSSPNTSSSGGAVSYTVSSLTEGRLDDGNGDFTNSGADPMNGMTVGGTGDPVRGVVFEWNGDATYEQEIVPGARDLTVYKYLMFRAAQATRHPRTTAELGDLTFSVSLRDGNGAVSTINIGAYGAGSKNPTSAPGAAAAPGGPTSSRPFACAWRISWPTGRDSI
jgi:hypothetical protein